ncbi:hypothetical protein WJX73_007357 [Symbiochloris irregularis]|uniref:Amidase domain-containing protein n=1 Tax=Symbiochloris irregularis TaxID=706552 RepID=A0AAW1PRR3_9CHLO
MLYRSGITATIQRRIISEAPSFQPNWPAERSSRSDVVKTVTLPSGRQHVGERVISCSLIAPEASTQRYQQGKPLSSLDGVPFAVIDCLHAGPYPTTAGTKQDAPSIAALLAAGAILVGKANLHEIGAGMTGINVHHGPCRNPHSPAHLCGGSSSGCAAIVASGICPFAIGVDGGGSLRVPAALCGVVGLKPTVGRSSAAGCTDNVTSILSIGPIAACVTDAMLVYAAIANAGCAASGVAPITVPHQLLHSKTVQARTAAPSPLRLGVYWRWFEDASTEVVSACKQALELFKSETGCEIVPMEIRGLEAARAGQLISVGASLAQAYRQLLKLRRSTLGPDTLATLLVAEQFTACDFLQAQQVRTRVMASFADAFKQADVIVTPTAPITAPSLRADTLSHGELNMMLAGELMRFTNAVNMAGLPAISVPISTAAGLPVGMQLIGQPWQEASLLYVSSALEAAVALQSPRRMPKVMHHVFKGLLPELLEGA